MLNYVEDDLLVPVKFRDFFADKSLIQEMCDKSNVVQINLYSPSSDSEEGDTIKIHLVGTFDAVENFKVMLHYQLSEYKKIGELRAKFKELLTGRSRGRITIDGSRKFADVVKSG